jgi:hypothetical protein
MRSTADEVFTPVKVPPPPEDNLAGTACQRAFAGAQQPPAEYGAVVAAMKEVRWSHRMLQVQVSRHAANHWTKWLARVKEPEAWGSVRTACGGTAATSYTVLPRTSAAF